MKCQIEISGGTTGMSAQGRQSGFGTEEKAQGYTEGNIKANKEKTRLVIDGAKKMCYHNLPSSLWLICYCGSGVEQRTRNAQVVSSNLTSSSTSGQTPLCSDVFLSSEQKERIGPLPFPVVKVEPAPLGFDFAAALPARFKRYIAWNELFSLHERHPYASSGIGHSAGGAVDKACLQQRFFTAGEQRLAR